MLRCTFALEMRRVQRMTQSLQIDRGALFGHYSAIKRGIELAAQIGFSEASRETQVTQFGGMTHRRIQGFRYMGALAMNTRTRGGRNG